MRKEIEQAIGIKLYGISLEPILGEEKISTDDGWLILGLQTPHNSKTFVPSKQYIKDLVEDHIERGVPVFMKDSMKHCWDDEIIREFPEGMRGII